MMQRKLQLAAWKLSGDNTKQMVLLPSSLHRGGARKQMWPTSQHGTNGVAGVMGIRLIPFRPILCQLPSRALRAGSPTVFNQHYQVSSIHDSLPGGRSPVRPAPTGEPINERDIQLQTPTATIYDNMGCGHCDFPHSESGG